MWFSNFLLQAALLLSENLISKKPLVTFRKPGFFFKKSGGVTEARWHRLLEWVGSEKMEAVKELGQIVK